MSAPNDRRWRKLLLRMLLFLIGNVAVQVASTALVANWEHLSEWLFALL